MAGENRTVQKVFEIVRGGRVPAISFVSQADTAAHLGKSENWVLRGSLAGGKIFIPKVLLDAEDVFGDVVISQNILEGTSLSAKTGESHARSGYLKIGFKGDDAPFHLDLALDADLAQLPPVLNRVVKSPSFLRELNLMDKVAGRATGRLILGENLKSVRTKVDVVQFTLRMDYERTPFSLDLAGGPFQYEGDSITAGPVEASFGTSRFSKLAVSYHWGENARHDLAASGSAKVALDEFFPWITSYEKIRKAIHIFESARGTILFEKIDFRGPLLHPKEWTFDLKGGVEGLAIQSPLFPGPVAVSTGGFVADRKRISLAGMQARGLDASLAISGELLGYTEGLKTTDLAFRGDVGPELNQWVSELVHLKPDLRLKAPLRVSESRLVRQKESGAVTFTGSMSVPDGPKLSIDLERTPESLSISSLKIADNTSNADITFNLSDSKAFDTELKGVLTHSTLDRLLIRNTLLSGSIEGNIKAHILVDQSLSSTATGDLRIAGFEYSGKLESPVTIKEASLGASGNKLTIKSAQLNWRESDMALKGDVLFSPQGFQLDLDLSTEGLNWEDIKADMEKDTSGKSKATPISAAENQRRLPVLPDLPFLGTIRVKSGHFTFGSYTWKPFEANVALGRDTTTIELVDAALCGIATPGTLVLSKSDGTVRLETEPSAQKMPLEDALTCLWNKKALMTGSFDLESRLAAFGSKSELLDRLRGNVQFNAHDGRIFRLGLVSKIFAMLNLTEVYRGQLPDLGGEGFAYESIVARGTVQEGKLTLEELTINGPSIKMVWRGDVDLKTREVDFTVLVAPLRTVDKLIGRVPLIGGLLGGSLISIPVGVSGNISDPDVIPLSPSAVGSELLGYMKRTLQFPFKVIQPLF